VIVPRDVSRRFVRGGFLACTLVCAVSPAALAQSRQPYTPTDDTPVLEHVGLPRAPGVLQLRDVREQWLAEPGNYAISLAYARVALDVGRQEDDPRYFGYAESALRPWLDRAQPPPEVLLLRASLRQVRKDFSGAMQDLDALVAAAGPESAQAQLARAGLHLTQGDPAAALNDCTALDRRIDPLLGGICVSAAQGLSGSAASALAALGKERQAALKASLPVRIWLLATAAGIADRLGQVDAARADYAEAQALLAAAGTRDPGLLAAYADCLLEQHRDIEVVRLLAAGTRIDSLLLRLALAERRLGEAGDASMTARADEHSATLGLRFDEARQRGDSLHLREEAMYQLALKHDAARALQLAQQDWQQQREPIDARVFLRAALATHNPQAAQSVLEWIQRTRLEDVYLKPLAARLEADGRAP
jgi:hypothetical protein